MKSVHFLKENKGIAAIFDNSIKIPFNSTVKEVIQNQ